MKHLLDYRGECYIRSRDNHLWHVIAEADGAHRDEDEVKALEEAPVLPHIVQGGAYEYVDQQDEYRHRDRQVELIVDGER